jgi:hypothetical protein
MRLRQHLPLASPPSRMSPANVPLFCHPDDGNICCECGEFGGTASDASIHSRRERGRATQKQFGSHAAAGVGQRTREVLGGIAFAVMVLGSARG